MAMISNEDVLFKTISQNINKYLEPARITIEKIFGDSQVRWTDCLIYGGAVRDAICDDPINDIDIIVKPDAKNKIVNVLKENSFKLLDDFAEEYFNEIYKDLELIDLPETYEKNGCEIQLIKPRSKHIQRIADPITGKIFYDWNNYNLQDFVKECDIRCCTVCWWATETEGYFDYDNEGVEDCINKELFIQIESKMFTMRNVTQRVKHFRQLGWKIKNNKEYLHWLAKIKNKKQLFESTNTGNFKFIFRSIDV